MKSVKYGFIENTTTAILDGKNTVRCVEHLSAAIRLLGVTDIEIRIISGSEIPLLDGSAAPYWQSFSKCLCDVGGLQYKNRDLVVTPKVIKVEGSKYQLAPASSFIVTAEVDYPSPLGNKIVSTEDLSSELLVSARTFIRDPVDVVPLRQAMLRVPGLAVALAENAVVIWNSKELISELRFDGEWAYHKLLDLIGDLDCFGTHFNAQINAYRPGHRVNHDLRTMIQENYYKKV